MAQVQQSTAIAAGSLTNLRANGTHSTKLHMVALPQFSFATAQINQSTFGKPLAQITIDNTSADWLNVEKDMTVWVGTSAGANDVGIYRVRKTPTANTLYMSELNSGDFGLLSKTGVHKALADNQYITIIDDCSAWSIFSRIVYTGGSGTFYKDYDINYTDQNETDFNHIVNIGEHRAGFISSATSDKFRQQFTASITTFISDTVSSYAWSKRALTSNATATVQAGAENSSTVTYDFSVGFFVVKLVVTFASGATVTVKRFVASLGSDVNNTIYSDYFDIKSDVRSEKERAISVELYDNFTSYLHGSMVFIFEESLWNNASITEASTKFVGYVKEINYSTGINRKTVTLELAQALDMLKNFSQQLTIVDNPANWQEVITSAGYIDYYVYYLLRYHSTLSTLYDFKHVGLTSYKAPFVSEPQTLYNQISAQAARLNCKIGQDSAGTIHLRRDYDFLSSSEKASEQSRLTITEDDLSSADGENILEYDYSFRARVGSVRVYGFSFATGKSSSAVAYISGAQGKSNLGYGAETQTIDGQLVLSQSELNTRAGILYAQYNNPYASINLKFNRNYDLFEPARGDIITLSLLSSNTLDAVAFNRVCKVKKVNVAYSLQGSKTVSIEVEAAVTGVDGETIPVPPNPDNVPYNLPEFDINNLPINPFLPDNIDNSVDTPLTENAILVAFSNTDIAATNDRKRANPNFEIIFTDSVIEDTNYSFDSAIVSDNTNKQLKVYTITDNTLYINSDIYTQTEWVEISPMAGYTLLRGCLHDKDAHVVYGQKVRTGESTATSTLSLTFGTGGYSNYTLSGDAVIDNIEGNPTPCVSSGVDDDIIIAIGGFDGAKVLSWTFDAKESPASVGSGDRKVTAVLTNGSTATLESPTSMSFNTAWTNYNKTVTQDTVEQMIFEFEAPSISSPTIFIDNINVVVTEEPIYDTVLKVSLDGTAIDYTYTAIESALTGGMDTGDFSATPYIIFTAGQKVYWVDNINAGTEREIVLTTPLTADGTIVRIPYYQFGTTTKNNVASAYHFIVGSQNKLYKIVADLSIPTSITITSQADITYNDGADDWFVPYPSALETKASNNNDIYAIMQKVGGDTNTQIFVYSANGGTSWTNRGARVGYKVQTKGNSVWVWEDDAISYTANNGVTFVTKTGNYSELTSGVKGGFVVG